MQFQKNNALDTKALGLEVSLAVAKFVTGKENMHYGVWDNLDPCLENLGKAQEQYTKLLFKYFPKKKKLKILDIGGGTTEVAVLSLGGTVLSESVRIAGDEINESIALYLKKVHNLVVGERTAEDIKIKIGSAFPDDDFDKTTLEVRGLHLLSGLPRSVTLTSGEIREAMAETLSKIVEAVKRTLERTPPELAADIVDRGIMLAGGGALVRGINDLLSDETGIFTHIAENPLLCVVNGCGEVLDDFKKLKRVVDTPEFIRNAIRD